MASTNTHRNSADVRASRKPSETCEFSLAHEKHATCALDAYMKTVGQFEQLTPDQEKAAGIVIQSSPNTPQAHQARQILITGNLRLVVGLAKNFQSPHIALEDLIAEGNCGLIKAVHHFNPLAFSNRFSTYAAHWIICFIKRARNRARVVRMPERRERQIAAILQAPSFSGCIEAGSIDDLSRETGLKPTDVEVALQFLKGVVSFDQNFRTEDGKECRLQIPDPISDPATALMTGDDLRLQAEAIATRLDERERLVVAKRYGIACDPLTLQEIAEIVGVTRDGVRQTLDRALSKLKQCFTDARR